MAKVTYLGTLTGESYSTPSYTLLAGEPTEVDDQEAARLLSDFPDHFSGPKKTPKSAPKTGEGGEGEGEDGASGEGEGGDEGKGQAGDEGSAKAAPKRKAR